MRALPAPSDTELVHLRMSQGRHVYCFRCAGYAFGHGSLGARASLRSLRAASRREFIDGTAALMTNRMED